MIPEAMQKVRRVAKQLQEDLKEAAKTEVIAEFFMAFFEANPTVKAVKWTQYTPHFNDGDACTFSVHEPEFAVTDEELKEPSEEWQSSWSVEGEQKKSLTEFESDFYALEDVFQLAFGDGFRVIVARDGGVEAEEYDHD